MKIWNDRLGRLFWHQYFLKLVPYDPLFRQYNEEHLYRSRTKMFLALYRRRNLVLSKYINVETLLLSEKQLLERSSEKFFNNWVTHKKLEFLPDKIYLSGISKFWSKNEHILFPHFWRQRLFVQTKFFDIKKLNWIHEQANYERNLFLIFSVIRSKFFFRGRLNGHFLLHFSDSKLESRVRPYGFSIADSSNDRLPYPLDGLAYYRLDQYVFHNTYTLNRAIPLLIPFFQNSEVKCGVINLANIFDADYQTLVAGTAASMDAFYSSYYTGSIAFFDVSKIDYLLGVSVRLGGFYNANHQKIHTFVRILNECIIRIGLPIYSLDRLNKGLFYFPIYESEEKITLSIRCTIIITFLRQIRLISESVFLKSERVNFFSCLYNYLIHVYKLRRFSKLKYPFYGFFEDRRSAWFLKICEELSIFQKELFFLPRVENLRSEMLTLYRNQLLWDLKFYFHNEGFLLKFNNFNFSALKNRLNSFLPTNFFFHQIVNFEKGKILRGNYLLQYLIPSSLKINNKLSFDGRNEMESFFVNAPIMHRVTNYLEFSLMHSVEKIKDRFLYGHVFVRLLWGYVINWFQKSQVVEFQTSFYLHFLRLKVKSVLFYEWYDNSELQERRFFYQVDRIRRVKVRQIGRTSIAFLNIIAILESLIITKFLCLVEFWEFFNKKLFYSNIKNMNVLTSSELAFEKKFLKNSVQFNEKVVSKIFSNIVTLQGKDLFSSFVTIKKILSYYSGFSANIFEPVKDVQFFKSDSYMSNFLNVLDKKYEFFIQKRFRMLEAKAKKNKFVINNIIRRFQLLIITKSLFNKGLKKTGSISDKHCSRLVCTHLSLTKEIESNLFVVKEKKLKPSFTTLKKKISYVISNSSHPQRQVFQRILNVVLGFSNPNISILKFLQIIAKRGEFTTLSSFTKKSNFNVLFNSFLEKYRISYLNKRAVFIHRKPGFMSFRDLESYSSANIYNIRRQDQFRYLGFHYDTHSTHQVRNVLLQPNMFISSSYNEKNEIHFKKARGLENLLKSRNLLSFGFRNYRKHPSQYRQLFHPISRLWWWRTVLRTVSKRGVGNELGKSIGEIFSQDMPYFLRFLRKKSNAEFTFSRPVLNNYFFSNLWGQSLGVNSTNNGLFVSSYKQLENWSNRFLLKNNLFQDLEKILFRLDEYKELHKSRNLDDLFGELFLKQRWVVAYRTVIKRIVRFIKRAYVRSLLNVVDIRKVILLFWRLLDKERRSGVIFSFKSYKSTKRIIMLFRGVFDGELLTPIYNLRLATAVSTPIVGKRYLARLQRVKYESDLKRLKILNLLIFIRRFKKNSVRKIKFYRFFVNLFYPLLLRENNNKTKKSYLIINNTRKIDTFSKFYLYLGYRLIARKTRIKIGLRWNDVFYIRGQKNLFSKKFIQIFNKNFFLPKHGSGKKLRKLNILNFYRFRFWFGKHVIIRITKKRSLKRLFLLINLVLKKFIFRPLYGVDQQFLKVLPFGSFINVKKKRLKFLKRHRTIYNIWTQNFIFFLIAYRILKRRRLKAIIPIFKPRLGYYKMKKFFYAKKKFIKFRKIGFISNYKYFKYVSFSRHNVFFFRNNPGKFFGHKLMGSYTWLRWFLKSQVLQLNKSFLYKKKTIQKKINKIILFKNNINSNSSGPFAVVRSGRYDSLNIVNRLTKVSGFYDNLPIYEGFSEEFIYTFVKLVFRIYKQKFISFCRLNSKLSMIKTNLVGSGIHFIEYLSLQKIVLFISKLSFFGNKKNLIKSNRESFFQLYHFYPKKKIFFLNDKQILFKFLKLFKSRNVLKSELSKKNFGIFSERNAQFLQYPFASFSYYIKNTFNKYGTILQKNIVNFTIKNFNSNDVNKIKNFYHFWMYGDNSQFSFRRFFFFHKDVFLKKVLNNTLFNVKFSYLSVLHLQKRNIILVVKVGKFFLKFFKQIDKLAVKQDISFFMIRFFFLYYLKKEFRRVKKKNKRLYSFCLKLFEKNLRKFWKKHGFFVYNQEFKFFILVRTFKYFRYRFSVSTVVVHDAKTVTKFSIENFLTQDFLKKK